MTVRELKKQLSKFDDDLSISFVDNKHLKDNRTLVTRFNEPFISKITTEFFGERKEVLKIVMGR